MLNNKIIIYELNEVPRIIYELYVKNHPNSAFAFFKDKGLVLDTHTKDEGELHPWSTWPTVHRGVYNFEHNIKFLNQDLSCSNKFKPIWKILSENKIDSGIFGSLQSYPPINNRYIKFHLPDTFAPDEKATSDKLSLFQSFNLSMTKGNKAISRRINNSQIQLFANLICKGLISLETLNDIFVHLIKEKLNYKYKSRRSLIQNVIGFQLFFNQLNQYKPKFCTYFTNHVAGMMHRYWRDLFPKDFDLTNDDIDSFHSKSIFKAMDIADSDLKKLLKFSQLNNYDLWVISSMGQKSIDRGEYIPELYLNNFKRFLLKQKLNENNFELLPAMQPDYCINCSTKKDLNTLRKSIKSFKDKTGKKMLIERYPPKGNRLNVFLRNSKSAALEGKLTFNEFEYSIHDLGFELIKRDIGTGYHTPEGIMLTFGKNNFRFEKYKNEKIETTRICPTILDLFNIKLPKYMGKPL